MLFGKRQMVRFIKSKLFRHDRPATIGFGVHECFADPLVRLNFRQTIRNILRTQWRNFDRLFRSQHGAAVWIVHRRAKAFHLGLVNVVQHG